MCVLFIYLTIGEDIRLFESFIVVYFTWLLWQYKDCQLELIDNQLHNAPTVQCIQTNQIISPATFVVLTFSTCLSFYKLFSHLSLCNFLLLLEGWALTYTIKFHLYFFFHCVFLFSYFWKKVTRSPTVRYQCIATVEIFTGIKFHKFTKMASFTQINFKYYWELIFTEILLYFIAGL